MAMSFRIDEPMDEEMNEDGSISPILNSRIYDSDIATMEGLNRSIKRLLSQGYELEIKIKCKIPKE